MNEQTDLSLRALRTVQEAAKQISTVVPIIQAAYFAAISMSDLKESIWVHSGQPRSLVVVFILPAVLWLISLLLAIQIFVPPAVGEGAQLRDVYRRTAITKYRLLRWSQYFLAAGLLVMTVAVSIYFLCVPPPPSSP